MKRKLVSAILCGAMVLAMMTGCGSSGDAKGAIPQTVFLREQIRDGRSVTGCSRKIFGRKPKC